MKSIATLQISSTDINQDGDVRMTANKNCIPYLVDLF